MPHIIDGKALAKIKLQDIKNYIQQNNLKLTLAVVLIGSDQASAIYVRNKLRKAEEVGIATKLIYKETESQKELKHLISKLNRDKTITGFFIQAPLPKPLNFTDLASLIKPDKDIDGLTPTNLGRLASNIINTPVSATPLAVLTALKSIPNFDFRGKHVVIIGRSNILGKPLALLLTNNDATVTLCHSKTINLQQLTLTADIIVSATGVKNLVTADMVKTGAVLIDCGSPNQEITDEAYKKSSYFTPVPGGIGPLTIACLLENLVGLIKQ